MLQTLLSRALPAPNPLDRMRERRVHPRTATYESALCRTDQNFSAFVVDSSPGGLRLRLEGGPALRIGQRLSLARSPAPGILALTFETVRVAWVQRHQEARFVGVVFDEKLPGTARRERRIYRRFTMEVPVTLTGINFSGNAITLDLSLRGARLLSKVPLRVGYPYRLALTQGLGVTAVALHAQVLQFGHQTRLCIPTVDARQQRRLLALLQGWQDAA
ncbi:MAG: PilZ domain-containing protein [Candidatus Eremiobacterota bacterium]